MSLAVWLAFVAACTALLLIPGPTGLRGLSRAPSRGRRVAVATALGAGTGDLVALTAALACAPLADARRARIARPATMRWPTRGGGAAPIGTGAATAPLRRPA